MVLYKNRKTHNIPIKPGCFWSWKKPLPSLLKKKNDTHNRTRTLVFFVWFWNLEIDFPPTTFRSSLKFLPLQNCWPNGLMNERWPHLFNTYHSYNSSTALAPLLGCIWVFSNLNFYWRKMDPKGNNNTTITIYEC